MTDISDPRPLYREALAWVTALMAEVRPEQLADPTPCDEFDVATLMGHLVATVDRARVIGEGGDPHTTPSWSPVSPTTSGRTRTTGRSRR
ncbi:maleylpyruvate isomerase N-terminal domain-containing protein [Prescottella defluvii]|nr:maleylpyruvate isomerase N-terminal domain-containing protein [Prescottella defluvii]